MSIELEKTPNLPRLVEAKERELDALKAALLAPEIEADITRRMSAAGMGRSDAIRLIELQREADGRGK